MRGGGRRARNHLQKIGRARELVRPNGALVRLEDAVDAHDLRVRVVAVEREAVARVVADLGAEAKGRERAVRVVVLQNLADREDGLRVRIGRLVESGCCGATAAVAAAVVGRDEVERLRVRGVAVGGREVDRDLRVVRVVLVSRLNDKCGVKTTELLH